MRAMKMMKMMMRPKNIWDGHKTYEKTDGYRKFRSILVLPRYHSGR